MKRALHINKEKLAILSAPLFSMDMELFSWGNCIGSSSQGPSMLCLLVSLSLLSLVNDIQVIKMRRFSYHSEIRIIFEQELYLFNYGHANNIKIY